MVRRADANQLSALLPCQGRVLAFELLAIMRLLNARPRPVVFFVAGFWLVLGALMRLGARAGGAGGHSSGGGGHSSSGGGSSFHSSSSSSGSGGSGGGIAGLFCFLFFAFIIVVLIVALRARKSRSGGVEEPIVPPGEDAEKLAAGLAAIPGFQIEAFRQKVADAFQRIQAAWSAQSLAEVRPFISDGIYQRFATQFRMMALLKQRNAISNVRILRIEPVAATRDGEYDVLQVYIEAAMNDAFVCELDHSLDTEGDDPFVEYWSFIRKQQPTKDGNIYQEKGCPSCGAPLPPDMGELCRCQYCQVMVNSGEFDWVLAEITQEDDYGHNSEMAPRVSPRLEEAVADLTREAPDLAVQLIEDKASNAFMQIMTALATRTPAAVRRFVSDDALAAITAMIPRENIIFNRIYLNEAVLLDATRANVRHVLNVGMTATMQRVKIGSGNKFIPVDDEEVKSGYVLVLERDAHAVPDKGALYQHQCPSCSGAIGDTLDINCQYCGVPLNSANNEWIVTGFRSIS